MEITHDVLKIVWLDAVAESGWEENATTKKLKLEECITVGFLIEKNKDSLIVASSVSKKENNARMCIPIKWIKSIKKLKI